MIKTISSWFLCVEPEERRKSFLMFLYYFIVILLQSILKSARGALFIDKYGVTNLPYAYIAEGVVLILGISLYALFARIVSRRTFYEGILVFLSANLVLLWGGLRLNVPYMPAFFYLWYTVFSVAMVTAFWNLANDLYNPANAKQMYGPIASGGSLGGMAGGAVTVYMMQWIKAEDLLLVSAGIFLICLLIVVWIFRIFGKEEPRDTEQVALPTIGTGAEEQKTTFEAAQSAVMIFLRSPYLWMIFLIVVSPKLTSVIIDYQFNAVVAKNMIGKEALAAFFGKFQFWLNGIAFVMQFLVTGVVLKFFGVGSSLFFLPVGLLVCSVFAFLHPALWVVVGLSLFERSMSYSVHQIGKELLYLPVAEKLRRRVKPIIEMLGSKGAKPLAGGLILAAVALWKIPADRIIVLLFFIIPAWFVLAWIAKKMYRNKGGL